MRTVFAAPFLVFLTPVIAAPAFAAEAPPATAATAVFTGSPTPLPGALAAWGRVPLPEGFEAGLAPDGEVLKFLIQVNNLLIENPDALDMSPAAASQILALIPKHEEALVAKKVKVQALKRLIQGAPSAPAKIPGPEIKASPTPAPDPERERILAVLTKLDEKVAALEAGARAQAEAATRQRSVDESLRRDQADLAAKGKGLEEGLARSRTSQEEAVTRLSALELKISTLDAGYQKHALDASSAKEAAEAGKTGLAAQFALTERLSHDMNKSAAQIQALEQENRNLRRDLVAIQELLKVSQSGTADLREDISYVRDQLEKRIRQEESVRKEKGAGILRHPAVPGAALVIGIVALIVAL